MKEKKIKLRIGLFSDLHYSVDSRPEEHKWFPAVYDLLARFSRKWADRFLAFWDRLTQSWAAICLIRLNREGRFDFFVNCGDTTPGTDEEGMKSEKAVEQARRAWWVIQTLTENQTVYAVSSNHDLGYFSALPGAQRKGPSDESYLNYQELFGPVWQTLVIKGIRLVFLYSYLLARPENDFVRQPYLLELKKQQEDWLKNKLGQTTEPLLIFLHDPLVLRQIYHLLEPYRYRLIATAAGHLHSRLLFRLLKWRYQEWRELKVEVVPAPWGWCGIGRKGRAAVLTVYEDNAAEFRIVK